MSCDILDFLLPTFFLCNVQELVQLLHGQYSDAGV